MGCPLSLSPCRGKGTKENLSQLFFPFHFLGWAKKRKELVSPHRRLLRDHRQKGKTVVVID
jgi:hypothetical protein